MSNPVVSAIKANLFSNPFFTNAKCESKINPTRTISAAAPKDDYSCEFGSPKYYLLCGFGGMLSCGLTHTAVVPLDLIKCRIQVDAAKYGNIVKGFKLTVAEE